MSNLTKTGLSAALIGAVALTVAGCDSAVIIGPGSTGPGDIGAAMGPNLLSDGSFEDGAANWEFCSSSGSSDTVSDPSKGNFALRLRDGACRSQNQPASTDSNYRLTCDAKRNVGGSAAITMSFQNLGLDSLDSHEVAVHSEAFTTLDVTMRAPAFTSYIEVRLNSSSDMTVDNCALTEVDLPTPELSLLNGDFTNGTQGWSQCADNDALIVNGIANLDAGACLKQAVDVSEAVARSAINNLVTVSAQCDQIVSDDQYAAMTAAFLDANNTLLASGAQPIEANTSATAVNLSAPKGSHTLEITLNSDGMTSVTRCGIVVLD